MKAIIRWGPRLQPVSYSTNVVHRIRDRNFTHVGIKQRIIHYDHPGTVTMLLAAEASYVNSNPSVPAILESSCSSFMIQATIVLPLQSSRSLLFLFCRVIHHPCKIRPAFRVSCRSRLLGTDRDVMCHSCLLESELINGHKAQVEWIDISVQSGYS